MKRDKEEFKAKKTERKVLLRISGRIFSLAGTRKIRRKGSPFPPSKKKPDVSGAAGTRGTSYRNSRNAGTRRIRKWIFTGQEYLTDTPQETAEQ